MTQPISTLPGVGDLQPSHFPSCRLNLSMDMTLPTAPPTNTPSVYCRDLTACISLVRYTSSGPLDLSGEVGRW